MRWLAVLVVGACTSSSGDEALRLRFTPDPGTAGSERYQCFGFDVAPLGGADLGAIRFVAADSPVFLHHLTLFGSRSAFPDGPVDCLEMPDDAVPMNVWAPGGTDVMLASDVSLVIPDGTARLIVQTHALRTGDGAAREREIVLEPRDAALQRAGWLPLRAPVPVIQPGQRVQIVATCTLASGLHVVSTWPHMHQIGAEFHGSIVRGATTVEPLVDIVPWDFNAQRAYAVDVELAAGDAIGTHCIWQNPTNAPVLPGPRITDEMCGQSMIAYPFDAAHCQ